MLPRYLDSFVALLVKSAIKHTLKVFVCCTVAPLDLPVLTAVVTEGKVPRVGEASGHLGKPIKARLVGLHHAFVCFVVGVLDTVFRIVKMFLEMES